MQEVRGKMKWQKDARSRWIKRGGIAYRNIWPVMYINLDEVNTSQKIVISPDKF
jgi:hypothetical protein